MAKKIRNRGISNLVSNQVSGKMQILTPAAPIFELSRRSLLRPHFLSGEQALHELGPFFLIAPLSLRSHRTRWALRNGLKSRHPTPLMLVRVLATTRYDLTEVHLRRRPLHPGAGRLTVDPIVEYLPQHGNHPGSLGFGVASGHEWSGQTGASQPFLSNSGGPSRIHKTPSCVRDRGSRSAGLPKASG